MTREQLIARLAELRGNHETLARNIQQAQANLNAMEGAMQDCEYWLAQCPEEAAKSSQN